MNEKGNNTTEEMAHDSQDDGFQPKDVHRSGSRKPIRFQFGPDTIDEDIEKFLDAILGPKKQQEHNNKDPEGDEPPLNSV